MLCDWSAECAQDAPTLVVPWADDESGLRYIDLRTEPYEIAEIAEAERFPAMGRALRSLNATRSPVITAKCDAWAVSVANEAEAIEPLRVELVLETDQATHGFASYIDFLWRDRGVFISSHQQQDRLDKLVRRAQKLEHPEAALECVLRPAFFDGATSLEGFAVTLYLTALGPDASTALHRWEYALEDLVGVLRAKEFEIPRGAATIDAGAGE